MEGNISSSMQPRRRADPRRCPAAMSPLLCPKKPPRPSRIKKGTFRAGIGNRSRPYTGVGVSPFFYPSQPTMLTDLPRHSNSFEAAVDAIVAGAIAALQQLLRADPNLIHATSTREHGATLLHYVAANGVEEYRQ